MKFLHLIVGITCFAHLCNAFNVMWHIYEINERIKSRRHLMYGDIIRPDVDGNELERDSDDPTSAPDLSSFPPQEYLPHDNRNDGPNELPEAYDLTPDLHFKAIIKNQGNNRWRNNEMPYEISNKYSATEKYTIQDAISALQSVTCFKFPKRNAKHKDYIYIDKKDGCYSFVGKKGGKQLVSLGNGCVYTGTIQHELMHALGIEHEHQRPDRDKYIKVMMQNVESGMGSNFNKVPYSHVDLHGLKYDFDSVMHYDGKAFGKYQNGKKLDTMVPIQSGITLRDNTKLTSQDIQKLKILGGCASGNKIKKNGKGKKKNRKQKKRRMMKLGQTDFE